MKYKRKYFRNNQWWFEPVNLNLLEKLRMFGFSCELNNPYPVVQIGYVMLTWDRDDWLNTIKVEWVWTAD